jgi:hypothetical protein
MHVHRPGPTIKLRSVKQARGPQAGAGLVLASGSALVASVQLETWCGWAWPEAAAAALRPLGLTTLAEGPGRSRSPIPPYPCRTHH